MKKKRQYRSNQGRSPEKESEIFKTLNVTIKLILIVGIILSLTFLILE
jgi:hypothetical protein